MSAGARGAGDVGCAVCTRGAGGTGGAGGAGGTDSIGGKGDAVTRQWIVVLAIHRFSQGVLLDVMFFHALHKNAGDNSF